MSTKIERKRTVDSAETSLKEIFRKTFRVSELNDEDSMGTIDLWDSMGHMELMIAVEQKFNIRIEPEDIINLTSVSALKKYLNEHL